MSECIFCKIVARTIPAALVYEDNVVVAFDDINPQAPIHTLVIPRKHVASIAELQDSDVELLGRLMLVGNKIAKQKGIADAGYRIVVNSGAHGGQSVFHLHLHVLGGRHLAWPPG
ncbi:MAG: histidine triad nucleotide-binding protein [Nitrospirae bacterium]|nr:histidine triad nucleotide-binding protein [Nitrospirota bacterium]MBU6479912.1 histidine triad nucleotide-binding protein [Nitrospirota bacterium]MDE3039086.1 histidine triad nucleotide-binding protein [Nitrospirota bacterium]MDE3048753.1 histidine triad nucleotide-binding protein [Nitrospirota bacterium]MDE3221051.1 histidine triad nucleotide-binding protein [Nitrospirota bacterium]